MTRILLVPGALLPEAIATGLRTEFAARQSSIPSALRDARYLDGGSVPEAAAGIVHRQWLMHRLGGGLPLPSAPYAWRALGSAEDALPAPPVDETWIAHCDPVHFALAPDHIRMLALDVDPLRDDEAATLLALANEAAAPEGWRFAIRDGAWFLLCSEPLHLDTVAPEAVFDQPVERRMPAGPDARRWRIVANEIQMRWHASPVQDAREHRGARPVNALWLHGGGCWMPLAGSPIGAVEGGDATERGWSLATGATVRTTRDASGNASGGTAAAPAPIGASDTVSIHSGLRTAFQRQDWADWLDRLPAFGAWLEQELAAARSQRPGTGTVELVLCGRTRFQRYAMRRDAWWTRWIGRTGRAEDRFIARSDPLPLPLDLSLDLALALPGGRREKT